MKIYRLKGCLVTDYGNRKYYEDIDLDIFLNEEDAEKAKQFYEDFEGDYEYGRESYEDIQIVREDIYGSFEEFKQDMIDDMVNGGF